MTTATAPRVLRGSFIALACGMATPVAAQKAPVPTPTAGAPQDRTERAAVQRTSDEITVTGWRLAAGGCASFIRSFRPPAA